MISLHFIFLLNKWSCHETWKMKPPIAALRVFLGPASSSYWSFILWLNLPQSHRNVKEALNVKSRVPISWSLHHRKIKNLLNNVVYVAGPKKTRNDCNWESPENVKNLKIFCWIWLSDYEIIIFPWYILHLLAPVVLWLGVSDIFIIHPNSNVSGSTRMLNRLVCIV